MLNCRKLLVCIWLLCLLASAANAQFTQQGILGTRANGPTGLQSLAISADGNTALVGNFLDNQNVGGAWVYTRSGGVWTQQGELVGSGAVGTAQQGESVALSADGNTALVGGFADNQNAGAAWIFTRSGDIWTQQGSKLVGSGAGAVGSASQGWSVALSGDGNTALLGGLGDNNDVGAAWVFTRSNGVWTQQGSKLVGSGWIGSAEQGKSVALSADGNTALVAGFGDNGGVGATWVFTRSVGVWSQQGNKLVGSGANGIPGQGSAVALSADGSTALVGGFTDGQRVGAAWVFTRSGGVWAQQGGKLTGAGTIGIANVGISTALSADGNAALIGGPSDNNGLGAVWVFTRSGGLWNQQGNKLMGSPVDAGNQGSAVALSADGFAALVSSDYDGTFVFVTPKPSTTTLATTADPSLYGQLVTYTATVTAGATGTVTFTVDGVAQSTVPLSSSQAHFSISKLTPGGHTVSAAYSGDATFAASTSNVIAQTVNPLGAISLWANTVVELGQSARLPVTLAKAAPPAGLTIYLDEQRSLQSHRDPKRVHRGRKADSEFTAGGERSEPGERYDHCHGVGLHASQPVGSRDCHYRVRAVLPDDLWRHHAKRRTDSFCSGTCRRSDYSINCRRPQGGHGTRHHHVPGECDERQRTHCRCESGRHGDPRRRLAESCANQYPGDGAIGQPATVTRNSSRGSAWCSMRYRPAPMIESNVA